MQSQSGWLVFYVDPEVKITVGVLGCRFCRWFAFVEEILESKVLAGEGRSDVVAVLPDFVVVKRGLKPVKFGSFLDDGLVSFG